MHKHMAEMYSNNCAQNSRNWAAKTFKVKLTWITSRGNRQFGILNNEDFENGFDSPSMCKHNYYLKELKKDIHE